MYFLLKMGIFHCYVSLPEGKASHLGFLPRLSNDRMNDDDDDE